MGTLSIRDVFKLGIGPSSSHTMGPWLAALQFIKELKQQQLDSPADKITVDIFGSLALTGKGHGTDKAILFGLMGLGYGDPQVQQIKNAPTYHQNSFELKGTTYHCHFKIEDHLSLVHENPDQLPNKMVFIAYNKHDKVLEKTFYSIGGGNLSGGQIKKPSATQVKKLNNSEELIELLNESNLNIPEFMRERELKRDPSFNLNTYSKQITDQMKDTVVKGLNTEGILPGTLKVKRRSGQLFRGITHQEIIQEYQDIRKGMRSKVWTFDEINTLISSIAMACNEENAAMNAVVTAPTNGACGVIPATIFYFDAFEKSLDDKALQDFLLTSALIGILFKNSATVSGAVGGCMAEIGVASSMAAAGLSFLKGGTTEQIFMAAEIAMEHHLGLTCDPIAGLVQIPCIERNAMGVIKAITASNIAMNSNPKEAVVKFRDIIATMNDTAKHMDKKYKETSLGGLAIKVNLPEC